MLFCRYRAEVLCSSLLLQGMVRLMQICRDWVMHTFLIPAFGPLLTAGVAIITYLAGVLTKVIVQLVNVATAFMVGQYGASSPGFEMRR